MKLPYVLQELVKAQNTYDTVAYSECFSETAKVVDEGEIYHGRKEIKDWIEKANNKYKTTIEPLHYQELKTENILSTKISGSFPGSPITLKYHLTLIDGYIQTLEITA